MPLVVNFKWKIEIGQCSICLVVNIYIYIYIYIFLLPYQVFLIKNLNLKKSFKMEVEHV